MGGGDLNLKKSWHPQTLKNVERVWKAEQKHEAEKKKIEELQKELREERAREEMQRYAEDSGAVKKKSDRLDWMYQGPSSMVNKEEYLLGRPIDKYATDKMVDEESGPSSETGLLPGSIFTATGANSALDMASKIREDPLFMIRKREEEKKREVLSNPMKMKMIREILQKNLDKTEKKKKDKKKKHKKHRRSSSSDNEHHTKKHEKSINSSSTSVPKKRPGYGLKVKDSHSIVQQQHSPSSDPAKVSHKTRPRSRSGSRSRTVIHQSRKDVKREDSRHRRSRSKSQSPPRHSKVHPRYDDKIGNVKARKSSLSRAGYHRRPYSDQSRKLSAEELERRRQEMMEDAKWNDKARQCNIRRYKEDDEMEQELERKDTRDGKFLHKIKLQSTATSSLEDRVKRNIHSIQRTPAALEKNFMRK
ncbi:pre-mRNA-splicing factor CWC25 homolog isoform X1 [Rhincodon typus]|uniref:pre-mRNA-splicing factor CWC25 homolog isoform X1 n=1 Tax=Rhincodon typus TaxID=259920 RepID=UPI00202DD9DD|nr:pre-mRNA-splicing factor CWC25 homolog isoform X1 [Rhincodon typus]